jgi:hypothetical protein
MQSETPPISEVELEKIQPRKQLPVSAAAMAAINAARKNACRKN